MDRDRVNILLSHNPDTFDRAAELGIDLSLAGHTHGGQAALEFISPEIAPSRLVTPYVAGWFRKPGGQLYVNRGIGTIFVPIRIGRSAGDHGVLAFARLNARERCADGGALQLAKMRQRRLGPRDQPIEHLVAALAELAHHADIGGEIAEAVLEKALRPIRERRRRRWRRGAAIRTGDGFDPGEDLRGGEALPAALARDLGHLEVSIDVGGQAVEAAQGVRAGEAAVHEKDAVERQADRLPRAELRVGAAASACSAFPEFFGSGRGRTSVLSPSRLLPRMTRFEPGRMTCQ